MIELEAVTKYYGRRSEVVALDEVDLAIAAGECVLVTGPSGAGKTTLLRLIAALELPDAGAVRLFDRDVRRLRRSSLPLVRRRVGVALQELQLLSDRTALDNVGVALEIRGLPRDEIRRRAAEALAAVGLATRTGARPDELSTGEQQRIAIARALVGEPAVLVLDEPTGNLDSATARELVWHLEDLSEAGTTVVITTNDRDVIELADTWRRVAIESGRVRADAPRVIPREDTDPMPAPNVVPFPVAASAGGQSE